MAARWQQNYEVYRKYLESTVTLYRSRHDLQLFTELILTVFAIIVFAIFAIRPTLVTIAGLWKEIQSKEDTIALMDTKIEQLNAAQVAYDKNRAGIDLLHEAIPQRANPQNFIRQIEGLVQRHGVILTGLTIDDTVLVGQAEPVATEGTDTVVIDANTIPVSVRVTGDYQNLQAFMSDIEKMRRPLYPDLASIAVNQLDDGNVLGVFIEGRIPFIPKTEDGL